VDRDGDIWAYDEIYKADADISEFAKSIKSKGFDTLQADPSVIAKGTQKKSPKQLYAEEGVTLLLADNDVDYFLGLFRQLLKKRKPDGSVCFHVNVDRCPNLVNQIKQAAWDPTTLTGTTRDKIRNPNKNHALDAFKYFLNTFGVNPGLLEPVRPGAKEVHAVKGEWEHESYWDDLDFGSEDYVHQGLKEVM
jgi:methionine synthase II (cobalamin-independent)